MYKSRILCYCISLACDDFMLYIIDKVNYEIGVKLEFRKELEGRRCVHHEGSEHRRRCRRKVFGGHFDFNSFYLLFIENIFY